MADYEIPRITFPQKELTVEKPRFRERKLFLEKRKRKTLTIALILIVLLFCSIFFGVNKKGRIEDKEQVVEVFELVNHKLEEAEALLSLNPQSARGVLAEAKNLLEEAEKIAPSQKQEIDKMKKKVEEKIILAKQSFLSEPEVFFELNIAKEGFLAKNISLYKEKLAILGQDGTVLTLDLESKKTAILGKVPSGEKIAIHGDNVFVLKQEGIFDPQGKTLIAEDDWGLIAGLSAYGGNIYLLDKGNNQIWKYMRTDGGFSARINYLAKDVSVSFFDTQNMVIDGNIYVLIGGEIIKFSSGKRDAFSLSGYDDVLNPRLLFTNEDCRMLYVLANDKVVIFDKEGKYQKEYRFTPQDFLGLVTLEKKETTLLVSQEKIFKIETKK